MSNPAATKIIANLNRLLKRAEHLAQEFKHSPLFALWVSVEEPSSNSDAHPICEKVVASYLRLAPAYSQIDLVDVMAVGRDEEISKGIDHWFPFYAFSKPAPHSVRNDLSIRTGTQLTAMGDLFASLEREISALPKRVKDRYRLPESSTELHPGPDWWRFLFHLAIHYPADQLRVSRNHWLNIFDVAHDPERKVGSYPRVSYTEKVPEHRWHLEKPPYLCADVCLGTIWCELESDIVTSTIQAIELLVRMVEEAYSEPPVLDPATFAGILRQFEALAEREPPPASEILETRRLSGDGSFFQLSFPEDSGGVGNLTFGMSHADEQIYRELSPRCVQPQLLRLGSHCCTPHLFDWCESLLTLPCEFVTVARWDSSAEFVAYRNMPPEFQGMCEEAGALLPESYGVVPALPTKATAWDHHKYVVPASDPISRWLRFVFETASVSESDVTVHFPPLPPDGPFGLPPYGFMRLKQSFFLASAMAIRVANPGYTFSAKPLVAPATSASLAPTASPTAPPAPLPLAFATPKTPSAIAELTEEERTAVALLEPAQRRAYLEFLIAEESLRRESDDWLLTVTLDEAFDWLEKSEDNNPTATRENWRRYVIAARTKLGKQVNRQRKPKRGSH